MRITPPASTRTPPTSSPAAIQPRDGSAAATLNVRGDRPRSVGVDVPTVQLPLWSGQVRVWVPGPVAWAAEMPGRGGRGRWSAAGVPGVDRGGNG